MAYEIINTLRAKSTVRITGNTSTSINLSNLSANTSLETVVGATIAQVTCSGDGVWRIYRGNNASANLVIELAGNNNLPLYEYDIVVANNATQNVFVTNSGTAGTLFMQLSKDTLYSSATVGV